MIESDSKMPLSLHDVNEAEETFIEDDESAGDDIPFYDENQWPKESPNGFSFKGKKRPFLRICEGLKILLKKGNEKIINNVSFKVLDLKKSQYGIDYEVEICKEKDRGIALMKIFGPNGKKGCTLTINKSKNYDEKFSQILALDVVKQLLDRFDACGGGWINVVKAIPKAPRENDGKKSQYCHFCGNGFASVRNLKVHIEKFHRVVTNSSGDESDLVTKDENDMKRHIEKGHDVSNEIESQLLCDWEKCDYKTSIIDELECHKKDTHKTEIETNDMEIDEPVGLTEALTKRDRSDSVPTSVSPPSKKVHEVSLEEEETVDVLKEKILQLTQNVRSLETENVKVNTDYVAVKEQAEKFKKEVRAQKNEIAKVVEENELLRKQLVDIQNEKNKIQCKLESEAKIKKVRENTKHFNDIIEGRLESGELRDIDNQKLRDKEDEDTSRKEVDDESLESLIINKKLGGKRLSPQDNPINIGEENIKKMLKCDQCDFMSQNQQYFNQHIESMHGKNPTCPFCLVEFKSYADVRKHCQETHNTVTAKSEPSRKIGSQRPCRFFQYGNGQCTPPSGVCHYSHDVVPENERQRCRHKEACVFKPHCVFFHPEGQRNEGWSQSRKSIKICFSAQKGLPCYRSVCLYAHPYVRNPMGIAQDFHQSAQKKPPLNVSVEEIMSVEGLSIDNFPMLTPRVSVIVRNPVPKSSTMKDLVQNLKVVKIQE